MFYKIASAFVNVFMRVLFLMRTQGQENVPKSGGLLLCSNHRSNWDPPAIASAVPRSLSFMAKEELFHNPLFGWFITVLGAFPIRRGKGDVGAVMAAIKLLSSGKATIVFPEGTRVHCDDPARKINTGIIRIAIKAKVPILPVYTNGKYKPFGGLKVCIGSPISYEAYYDTTPDAETLERLARELMEAIYSFSEDKKS